MRNFKINWAVILAMMVLLAFTYFSFMGALYSKYVNGDLIKGGIYALLVILLVSICVVIMCVSKSTRWKEIGTAGQAVFAVIIFAVLGFSVIPFSGFMRAIDQKKEIQSVIDSIKHDAENLDMEYNVYAEGRIKNYEQFLRNAQVLQNDSLLSDSASSVLASVSAILQHAGGNTDEEKIENLTASLRNHLMPQSIEKCQKERKEWLAEIQGMSPWNIKMPKNIDILSKSTDKWIKEYEDLSSICFEGEDHTPFKHDRPKNTLGMLGELYWKSPLAIIAALFSFFVMLLPYIVAEGSYATRESRKPKKETRKDGNKTTVEQENDYE